MLSRKFDAETETVPARMAHGEDGKAEEPRVPRDSVALDHMARLGRTSAPKAPAVVAGMDTTVCSGMNSRSFQSFTKRMCMGPPWWEAPCGKSAMISGRADAA